MGKKRSEIVIIPFAHNGDFSTGMLASEMKFFSSN